MTNTTTTHGERPADEGRTTVPAHRRDVTYLARYVHEVGDACLPREVWQLVDGRVLAVYGDDRRHLFDNMRGLAEVHPMQSWGRPDGERRDITAPSRWDAACRVDWAEIHVCGWTIDQERRGTRWGQDGYIDALGGSYYWTSYSTLADLVRLLRGVDAIARDAWEALHDAGTRYAHGDLDHSEAVAIGRQACRVAIACSRLYDALHGAGLIDDPRGRICGTGHGYGLTGLGWLAGRRYDDGCTSVEVEEFAYRGTLPVKIGGAA